MSSSATPRVSVIVAVYNGTGTLPATLASLVKQTYSDFEVIFVNDESTDDSVGKIRTFTKTHPEFRHTIIDQKNKGLGGARNRGMREAKGLILALLDQDDIWYPEKLEKTVGIFENQKDISFVTHPLYRQVAGERKRKLSCDFMADNVYEKLLFKGNYFCGSAMSFRKEVLETNGYFLEGKGPYYMCEDFDYWLRAAARGLKFHVLEDVLGEYVVHGANFSKNRHQMLKNEWYVLRDHYQKRAKRRWRDPLYLAKRRGRMMAQHLYAFINS